MVGKGICRALGVLLFCSFSQGQAMDFNGTSLNEIPVCDDVIERIVLFALGSENPAKTLANLSRVSRNFYTNVNSIYEKYFFGLKEQDLKKVPRESLRLVAKAVELPLGLDRAKVLMNFIEEQEYKTIEILAFAYGIAKTGSWQKTLLNEVLIAMISDEVKGLARERFPYGFESSEDGREYKERIKRCMRSFQQLGENGCLDALTAVISQENKTFFCGANVPDCFKSETPIEYVIFGALETMHLDVISYFLRENEVALAESFFLKCLISKSDFEARQLFLAANCLKMGRSFWEDDSLVFEGEAFCSKMEKYFDEQKKAATKNESVRARIHVQCMAFLVYCEYKKCCKTYQRIMCKNKDLITEKDLFLLLKLNKTFNGPKEIETSLKRLGSSGCVIL